MKLIKDRVENKNLRYQIWNQVHMECCSPINLHVSKIIDTEVWRHAFGSLWIGNQIK